MKDRYAIGEAYGGSARWASPSCTTIEWEWVHTGRAFARAHPLGRFGGGLWWIAGFLVLGVGLNLFLMVAEAWWYGLFGAYEIAALWALFARSQLAYPLVWLPLIGAIPFTLPLVFYWAEGVRPNLIYRHRFERLVRST